MLLTSNLLYVKIVCDKRKFTIMKRIKTRLFKKAKKKHKKIFPCAKSGGFQDCYTLHNNILYFWYNTEDDNTHVELEKLPK